MLHYRWFLFYQRTNWTILIMDLDKSPVTTESNLTAAKRFVDMINDSMPSIDAVNEFAAD